ncbi:MAG TPA: flagellin, partial [Alphaproteobacteria bacterium]|nr:flagellin [Alphaproteobacteria bacterium]
NLATSVQNSEAARSSLMDLDMASEMTKFTSAKVLEDAGISMLAQANQLPQSLMKLFQ